MQHPLLYHLLKLNNANTSPINIEIKFLTILLSQTNANKCIPLTKHAECDATENHYLAYEI